MADCTRCSVAVHSPTLVFISEVTPGEEDFATMSWVAEAAGAAKWACRPDLACDDMIECLQRRGCLAVALGPIPAMFIEAPAPGNVDGWKASLWTAKEMRIRTSLRGRLALAIKAISAALHPAPVIAEPVQVAVQTVPFVHLHVHSDNSLLDGASGVETLVDDVKAAGMPALALTDHGTTAGLYSFHGACVAAGVKPVMGVEAYFVDDAKVARENKDKTRSHLTLLCRNEVGYRNLLKLMSRAHQERYYKPLIDWASLKEHAEGLVILTGCVQGYVPRLLRDGRTAEADRALIRMKSLVGSENVYGEIMPHKWTEQKRTNELVLAASTRANISLLATNDVHYARDGLQRAHDAHVGIRSAEPYKVRSLWLKRGEEMVKALRSLHPDWYGPFIDGLVAKTVKFADSVEAFDLAEKRNILPTWAGDAAADLRSAAETGLRARLGREPPAEYVDRLEHELTVIGARQGARDYFLLIWDLLRHCREVGMELGAGRGSASGSLVAWSLGITGVDPIVHDLMFERFLSAERDDMPDVDIDFPDDRREEVVAYLESRYGVERVVRLSVNVQMKGRLVLKDVARSLGIPYGDVNAVTAHVSQARGDEGGHTILESVEHSPELKAFAERYPEAIRLATELEGRIRTRSVHAAGILISDRPMEDYQAIEIRGEDGVRTSSYSPEDCQAMGLLKLDILALKTLTIVGRASKASLDWDAAGLGDSAVYREFTAGHTTGVFIFETPGMTRMCKEAGVPDFKALCALNALHRPGPLQSGGLG